MHSLYLIDLVTSKSFSFSLTFSSLIEVNSDRVWLYIGGRRLHIYFGETLGHVSLSLKLDGQCSKWRLNVAEFKAELPVDVLHSVCQ